MGVRLSFPANRCEQKMETQLVYLETWLCKTNHHFSVLKNYWRHFSQQRLTSGGCESGAGALGGSGPAAGPQWTWAPSPAAAGTGRNSSGTQWTGSCGTCPPSPAISSHYIGVKASSCSSISIIAPLVLSVLSLSICPICPIKVWWNIYYSNIHISVLL